MKCTLCPRMCGVDRTVTLGACHTGDKIVVAKTMIHKWEEPSISTVDHEKTALSVDNQTGSGAIFFSGCSLGCVYCQNREISRRNIGREMSVEELADEMLSLQKQGAYNINLVTPTHFSDKIAKSVSLISGELKIPIVYNTSGYELPEIVEEVSKFADIFLTDMKYFSPDMSRKYSFAPDYYKYAKQSLAKMLEAKPKPVYNNGLMKSGVIMRHLVLPGGRHDSINLLDNIAASFDIKKFVLSLMSQYTPDFCPGEYPELKRKLTTFEYMSVLEHAKKLGYEGYMQDISSSSKIFTPKFKEDKNEQF